MLIFAVDPIRQYMVTWKDAEIWHIVYRESGAHTWDNFAEAKKEADYFVTQFGAIEARVLELSSKPAYTLRRPPDGGELERTITGICGKCGQMKELRRNPMDPIASCSECLEAQKGKATS